MASVRTKPNGSYEVLYRDPNGRQRSKSFKRKDGRHFYQALLRYLRRTASSAR